MFIGLFCLMNVGAGVGFALDARERRGVLAKLQTAELGFRITPDGTWVWRFSVDPLLGEQGVPTGTAVALAELLGVPYSRLRAALPDDLVNFGMGDVMGRRKVLSITALETALAEQLSARRSKPRRKETRKAAAADPPAAAPFHVSPSSATRRALLAARLDAGIAVTPTAAIPAGEFDPPGAATASANAKQRRIALVLAEAETEAAAAPSGDVATGDDCVLADDVPDYGQLERDAPEVDVLDELLGTALVLAFLQVGALMPVVELARRRAAATRFFDGVTVRPPSMCCWAGGTRADSPRHLADPRGLDV